MHGDKQLCRHLGILELRPGVWYLQILWLSITYTAPRLLGREEITHRPTTPCAFDITEFLRRIFSYFYDSKDM
jgi:hypothetical protein